MFKNLTIRKRIMVILVIVYIVSLVIAVTGGWIVLRQDTIRESDEKATILLASMQASRKYLKKVLRPKLQEILPGKFVLEGMSSTFMSIGVSKFVQKKHPEYIYKVASPNPLNIKNLSDKFEQGVIEIFSKSKMKEWRGFMEKRGKPFYSVALPIVSEAKCLRCHSTPDVTYPSLVERYGTKTGYGYKVGEVVGGIFVYVPADVAISQATKKLLYFSIGFSIFFFIVLVVVDRIIVRSVVEPIENFVSVAEDISKGRFDREFEVTTNDEMKSIADAFTRMKISLAKAMDILKEK